MCGQMRSEKPWTADIQFFGDFLRADSPFDKEYNHNAWWALQQLEKGRKVRKRDWPRGQYAFLLNQAGDLKGNTWQVDNDALKKLLGRPFKPVIMLADADDRICEPLAEIRNLTTDNWALYE
ncbi:hypothetical protein [Oligoflexus tunisiensis]|uniref:hypothetical protein n=1 Tax=Oligoflexus tunisiensis TaxID=708132 RepID=UPI001C40235A|nr:hypothetical protein [Oligoflexus tunisiensis]